MKNLFDTPEWLKPKAVPTLETIQSYAIEKIKMDQGFATDEEAARVLIAARKAWNTGVRFGKDGTLLNRVGDLLASEEGSIDKKSLGALFVKIIPALKSPGYGVARLGLTEKEIYEFGLEDTSFHLPQLAALSLLQGKDLSNVEVKSALGSLFMTSSYAQGLVSTLGSKYNLSFDDIAGSL
jgi:hypothetical protein